MYRQERKIKISSNELYQKWLETRNERIELENKIEELVERWKNKQTTISNQLIQQTIEKGYERLERLKKMKSNYMMNILMNISNRSKEKKKKDTLTLVYNITQEYKLVI